MSKIQERNDALDKIMLDLWEQFKTDPHYTKADEAIAEFTFLKTYEWFREQMIGILIRSAKETELMRRLQKEYWQFGGDRRIAASKRQEGIVDQLMKELIRKKLIPDPSNKASQPGLFG